MTPHARHGFAQGVAGTADGRGPQPPWAQAGAPPVQPVAAPPMHHVAAPPVAPAAPLAAAAAMPVASAARASANRRRARSEPRTGGIYTLMLLFTVVAMGLVWSSPRDVRWGADVFGAGMLLAALARVVLPARSAGMLATRQRLTDAATLAILGLGTLVVGLVLPPPT
jgi:hypothetical protein